MEVEEYIQYYVVNSELGMSKGKIAAQVAHGATMMTLAEGNTRSFQTWFRLHQKKVILRGKKKELERLLTEVQGALKVVDNGLTEIPAGSMTVVVLPPGPKTDMHPYVKRLQLLKE